MSLDRQGPCPECGADWRSSPIPVEYVLADHYGHVVPCTRKFMYPVKDTTPCTCPPRYYSRLIGIQLPYDDPNHFDGVSFWRCPDCGAQWNRFTEELVSRYTWPPSRLYEQRKALESAKEIVRRVHADGKLTDVQRDEQLYKINQRLSGMEEAP